MRDLTIFVKGVPMVQEDKDQFDLDTFESYKIINEISKEINYSLKPVSLKEIVSHEVLYNREGNVLFYYTGHANGTYIGTKDFKISEVIDFLKSFKGDKYIIIDGCAVDEEFEKHSWPKNSKIISAKEIYPSKSIAKLLYDSIILRGNNLQNLSKETFKDMKHNWVYFKEIK